jgi:hypothetical protein
VITKLNPNDKFNQAQLAAISRNMEESSDGSSEIQNFDDFDRPLLWEISAFLGTFIENLKYF